MYIKHRQIITITFFIAWAFPIALRAQTDATLDPELGGRVSVSLDKKIVKGLHASLEEEVRFDNNFGSLDRLQTSIGLSYKVHPNIKLGLGYALINGYGTKSESFKNPRHRMVADVMGTLHLGYWNLSLKERFQVTRRTGDFNIYQNPKNALTLKSRFMAQYKSGKVQPYVFFELRTYLNAPVIEADFDGMNYYTLDEHSEIGEPGWFLKGFHGIYNNRLRSSIGVDIKLNRHNTLNFYLLGDYCFDKEVNANAQGTILKSYRREKVFRGWVGAEYEFAF